MEEKDVVVVRSDAIIPGVSEWERPLKRETINESCNILPPKESALSLECQLEISGIYEREGLYRKRPHFLVIYIYRSIKTSSTYI